MLGPSRVAVPVGSAASPGLGIALSRSGPMSAATACCGRGECLFGPGFLGPSFASLSFSSTLLFLLFVKYPLSYLHQALFPSRSHSFLLSLFLALTFSCSLFIFSFLSSSIFSLSCFLSCPHFPSLFLKSSLSQYVFFPSFLSFLLSPSLCLVTSPAFTYLSMFI